MLLRKISLKGFLSYYGRKDENGQVKPVEIDLSAAPLWLIYGPNGSGKSALFDAITFALYKKHRASGQDVGRKLHYLVHDAAEGDKAEINLEIDLNGQRYLIQRTITRTVRKKRGKEEVHSSVWGIIRQWPGVDKPYDEWPALPNTTNKVKDWVKKNLRMSSDTFTSAVVLCQGEADAFLKAKPSSRKTRLLELLDLQFYEKLGQAANKKKSEWDKELKKCQDELDKTEKVTEEDLSVQEKLISDNLGQKLEAVKKILKDKFTELDNAKSYSNLSEKIDQKEQRQREDDQLIQQAETIFANVRRYRELDKVLLVLDSLWSARNRLAAEEGKIKEKLEAIKKYQIDNAGLTPQLQKAREDEGAANGVLEIKDGELTQALERQRELKRQLEQLEQIEGLEQQIREAEEKLSPYKEILGEANEIKQKYQRYEILRDTILPLLRTLKDAEEHLQEIQANFNTAEDNLNEWKEKVNEAKSKEEVSKQEAENKKLACDEVGRSLTDIEKSISLLRQKLDNRESVSDQPECPICGSRLDDEETQARLTNERSHWQQEIKGLEDRKQQLDEELKLKEQEKRDAQGELKNAHDTTRKLENELAGYQRDVEHWEGNLRQAEQTLEKARQNASDWLEELEQLDNLEAEFTLLKETSSQRWNELQDAYQAKSATQATFDTCRTQLARLPNWSIAERQQLKMECKAIDQKVSDCQQSKGDAAEEVIRTKSHREGLEEQQRRLESDLALAENHLKYLRQNKQQTEGEIEQQQQKLPSGWIDHPACIEETALNELRKEFDGLGCAEEQESQLQQAQQRVNVLTGAIEILRTQLENIPLQHRRPVADVQTEWDTADADVKRCEERLGEERENLVKMREQKKTYEERRNKRDEAAKELSYYKRLADAFGGRKGLRAKIVQAAQESIKINANSTLDRLSNGVWQVELLEDATGEELEILACDTSQPGMPLRPFEYISGGERFRVAISLAVAIGQSVSGGRTVDTLVIDEGFGSLDEVNRDLLVDELQRLSRDVLQGGRVVVVSHQEDVCEKFGNRYHISKDTNGAVQIDYNPPC